jgi:AraC family transcriptional regulator of adaptative response / DNA-3-methyladenine glycosylase II
VRVPGYADPAEAAIRALVGQQVSVSAARTKLSRLVASYGKPLAAPDGGVTHTFPSMEMLAGVDPDTLGMPRARGRAIVLLADALASGRLRLDAGVDRHDAERELLALPGVGPWTAAYVAMRGLADPDAFPVTDLGVRRGLERLGVPPEPAAAEEHARRWQPWRSYAVMHLWRAQGRSCAGVPTEAMSLTRRQDR